MTKQSYSEGINEWGWDRDREITKPKHFVNAAFTPLHLRETYVPETNQPLPKVKVKETAEPEAQFEYTVEIACTEEELQLSGIQMFALGKTQNENSVASWKQKLHHETGHVLFTCSVMENEPKTLHHSFIIGVNSALRVQDVMPSEKGTSVAKESFIPIKPAVQVGQLLGWPAEGFFYHFIDGELIHEYRLLGKGCLAFQVTASTAAKISDQLLFPHWQTVILLPWKRKEQIVARQHILYSQEKMSNQQLGEITLSWLDEHGCALDIEKIVASRSLPIMPREKEDESEADDAASEPSYHVVAMKDDNSASEWWSDIAPKYNLTAKGLLDLNPSFDDDPMALKLGDVLSVVSNKNQQSTMKTKSTLPPLKPPYTVAPFGNLHYQYWQRMLASQVVALHSSSQLTPTFPVVNVAQTKHCQSAPFTFSG
ncbi:hypothetical protein [uncultured Photobacterium sp.]|uniref:hypothetical protein n=1 Tax=uncultured Photobacterium sp. TaxID=173973 RepID=UPI002611C377|nr:hypothetical protein [uncultured Photobacterium sp.]